MTRAVLAVICALFACATAAADIGAVVLHGKWGSPKGHVKPLADALAREGFLVASPDMPWSRQRAYARSVADAPASSAALIAEWMREVADAVR